MTAPARIRTELTLPLRIDGFATVGRVFTFDGLVDGREHLAIGLGSCAAAVRGVPPGNRGATGAAAQRVPDRRRPRQ